MFRVVENFDCPVYVRGSLIFFMRFTKETFVRFQLCLFLDQIKLRFVLVDVGARRALIGLHRPKRSAFGKELIQFNFLRVSAEVEGLSGLPVNNSITSLCGRGGNNFFRAV